MSAGAAPAPNARAGFTLVELTVALTLGLLVAGLVHGQLLHGRRVHRAQLERTALQENVRVAAVVLARELAPLGHDEITPEAAAVLGAAAELRPDLRRLQPGAVTYLAARGAGHVCGTIPGPSPEVLVESSTWRSHRAPRSSDSLLVFLESDAATAADDAWVHLGVAASGGSACPGGEPALAIRVGLPPSLTPALLAGVTVGAPVRLAEVMEARYYASGGKSWLGLRSVSTGEAITPVAGPLADSTAAVRGLTFRYFDGAGAATLDPARVRTVELTLVGVTDQPVYGRRTHQALVDTLALTTRVALRGGSSP